MRTFCDWNDLPAASFEADLVAHSGPRADGSFVQTLVLTDIATGWTDYMPLLCREQTLLTEVLSQMQTRLPIPVLRLDTDNNGVFMNTTVSEYCAAGGIEFTRSWPYRKNHQAWVEQKNGDIVRRMAGYRRYEGLEAPANLDLLYAWARLFVNFFKLSFKTSGEASRRRPRSQVISQPGDALPTTAYDPRTHPEVAQRVSAVYATLDPARLLQDIRARQQLLVDIADAPLHAATATISALNRFLKLNLYYLAQACRLYR